MTRSIRALALAALSAAAFTATRVATTTATAAATALTTTAAEHLHLVCDDFRAVLLLAVLFPLTGLEPAFDVDRRTLLQVFTGNFSQAAEEGDAVPLGGFLHFAAGLVFVAVGGCHANVGDSIATGHVTRFRIGAEIADDDDFVDGRHDEFPKVIEVMPPLGPGFSVSAQRRHLHGARNYKPGKSQRGAG